MKSRNENVFRCLGALAFAGLVAVPSVGHTALVGRYLTVDSLNTGVADAYYDTVLNITWLANANLAASKTFGVSGIDPQFGMTWSTANAWIDAMNTATYLGYDGWRLPTLSPIGTSFNYNLSNNATTDRGYAKTTTDGSDGGWRNADGNPVSELGHMFYVNLGNLGRCTPNDQVPGGGCVSQNEGQFNTGPFTNLEKTTYWTGLGLDNRGPGWEVYAWVLYGNGQPQDSFRKEQGGPRAWAVHDGDLPSVPLPAAG